MSNHYWIRYTHTEIHTEAHRGTHTYTHAHTHTHTYIYIYIYIYIYLVGQNFDDSTGKLKESRYALIKKVILSQTTPDHLLFKDLFI